MINLDKLGKFVNTFTQHILSCPQSAQLEGTQAVTIEGESQQGLGINYWYEMQWLHHSFEAGNIGQGYMSNRQ